MSNADRPHDQFHPSDGEADGLITVEDLLGQLDRVDASSAPEPDFDPDGLDRLMAWMTSAAPSDHDVIDTGAGSPTNGPMTAKILIAGGRRAGSADFITEISEFSATTHFYVPGQNSTSAQQEYHSLLFGRITVSEDLQLYNLATPDVFDPHVWDDLKGGAIGTLVLADPRKMTDCYPTLNYLDHCGMPYALALRGSSERCPYGLSEIREALRLPEEITILFWEPGRRVDSAAALIAVVEAALVQGRTEAPTENADLDEEMVALTLLAQLELYCSGHTQG